MANIVDLLEKKKKGEKLTKKQEEKLKKWEKQYYNTCPTRAEVYGVVGNVDRKVDNLMKDITPFLVGYMTIKKLLIEKEIITEEEFNKMHDETLKELAENDREEDKE